MMTTAAKKNLNVGLIGHGFMGAAHSQGWRVAPRFFDLDVEPRMAVIVGRDARATETARVKLGWHAAETDWRRVVADPAIDVIDICTPGGSHAEIAVAALAAGKHVLCEKPLANTLAEAEQMAAAAVQAAERGVRSMVGFSYRRLPAVALARQLITDGRLGQIREIRADYLQDWLVDQDSPLTWRLDRSRAGSGPLGDLGAHAIDLAQYLTGYSVDEVSATTTTFVSERPLLAERTGLSGTASTERGAVTVEDAAWITARMSHRAIGSFHATRYATGRKNALRVEISGADGAVSFDAERLNELEFYDNTLPESERGFTTISVTAASHPYLSAWWPEGHTLGWEHTFSHQVHDFVRAISEERDPAPSFVDGLNIQRVLDASLRSADNDSTWTVIQPSS